MPRQISWEFYLLWARQAQFVSQLQPHTLLHKEINLSKKNLKKKKKLNEYEKFCVVGPLTANKPYEKLATINS